MKQSVSTKPPRPVFETVFAFPPNRDSLGGSSYLIVETVAGQAANLLVDVPAWEDDTQAFLMAQGGVRWLLITHRGAMGKARELQRALSCEVVVQEQEAYLLPETPVTSFQEKFAFENGCWAYWTPGHSPGSTCLYYPAYGGVLFTGRHLLPDRQGNPTPLRFSKTFHWPRQLRSVEWLQNQFSADQLSYICPGANTGFLRGERAIANAYARLKALDLNAQRQVKPVL